MRRKPEDRPVIAICYDFDKTLTPDDMQAQGFIQSVGYDVQDFWQEVNRMAEENDMDTNLAYMYKMVEEARGKHVFDRKSMEDYGAKIELFPGVESWFDRVNKYGDIMGVDVEHYIISSGLKEMIEGTVLGKEGVFKRIYASSFYYDEKGIAVWPAQAINYTNKTQFLFRIEKGVLDVNDQEVNSYYKPGEHRVPFSQMVYIGDSDTDIPCMRLVNMNGGHSIGVYNPYTNDKVKVHRMIKEHRIRYFAAADYREGEHLDTLIKAIINQVNTKEVLDYQHYLNTLDVK
ncbi:haloacid dehalogenase-like hydrolase [Erysipelothrix sp. HDW6C]|uniref:HAD family hydrolase n=1 Tax=Erysipelothrix sp. HDW6C TaxID=2714930 RepID=UPI00140C8A8A|nr:HAD family hydrolase [Erysipelothrix sp. HDW6C]QIK70602.1 haloacid dehalogenase-like hydrolase [Erysipelothrix sp. HDW6C]